MAITLLSFVLCLTACNNKTAATSGDGRVRVVTTIFPIYDFVRAVAGDKAESTLLVAPGATIHAYDPSPSDMIRIGNADLFIYIGGESDAWVDRLVAAQQPRAMLSFIDCVTDTAPDEHTDSTHEHDHPDSTAEHDHAGLTDEHIWTSPTLAIQMVQKISDALCAADAENTAVYRANAADYIERIRKIDADIRAIVHTAARKTIVVADRFPFQHFTETYGLTYMAAFDGCSDQTDAGAATIKRIIDTVRDERIPCIYYVELSTQNVAVTVAEQTNVERLLLHSCQNVSRTDFEAGVTYASLMEQNVENLRKGLE